MNKYLLIGLVLLLGASHWGAYQYGDYVRGLTATASASEQVAVNATAQTGLVVAERKIEQQAQAAANEVSINAVVDQTTLVATLAIANGTVDRLQRELASTRDNLAGSGNYATLAERSASATRASMVLSELYGSCQRRVVEVTGLYQDARQRGLNCSTIYDNVRTVINDGS